MAGRSENDKPKSRKTPIGRHEIRRRKGKRSALPRTGKEEVESCGGLAGPPYRCSKKLTGRVCGFTPASWPPPRSP